jgi:filamentous hemagglutinin family protein
MAKNKGFSAAFRPKLVSLAVASCFVTNPAFANPTGPTVVHGAAAIHQAGNLLQVTNTPNAIINWQSFSIGANEITRFIQQSQASAVLNRVVGAGGAIDPSVILGALQSNGRVFLINPSGILFGAGAQVDVAGLVASSLNLSNADFLANRLNFTAVPGAGSVVNQGNINTSSGGGVYLIGSAVTNNGIITSPQGEVILAAGNSVELVEPGTPNLRVEITAPDNEVRNLGQIVADSGRVGIYAGLINNAGTIRANSAVAEGGKILLKATRNVTLESSSILDASGAGGGTIDVLSKNGGTVNVAGRLDASAPVSGDGGFIETSADSVKVADGTRVTTAAPQGKTGMWLIDPIGGDFMIASYGGDISGATLALNLGSDGTSFTYTSDSGASYGSGNINVNDPVSWSSSNSLTLIARNVVSVNQPITNAGSGSIALYGGWDGVSTTTPSVAAGYGGINVNAAVSTLGNVFLIAGNTIYGTSAPITANQLLVDGGLGGVFLDSATNMVDTLAGRTGSGPFAGFHFSNGKSLTIGSVTKPGGGTVSGITTGNGEIVVNAAGALTVSNPISAMALAGSYGGSVSLSGDNGVIINSAVSVQGGSNSGGVTTADGNSAYLSVNSNGGSITVNAGGSLSASAGNAGNTSDAYGGTAASTGGGASIYLTAAKGITVNGSIAASGGDGGTATATNGTAFAWGGYADVSLYGGTGGVTGSGNISANAGAGGIANGLIYADASGGYSGVWIDGAGLVSLSGAISSTAGSGGAASAASGSAYSYGGGGNVEISSATGVTLNGLVSATGADGGGSSGSFHSADGGSGFVQVGTPGSVTIGAGGITVTGGDGGTGGPRSGGVASIVISGDSGESESQFLCDGVCSSFSTSAGAIQLSGKLAATGGNGTNGGQGGEALVVAAGGSVNIGAAISATGGNGTPAGVAEVDIFSLGDVTLGGNVTTNGSVFIDELGGRYGGIYIEAGLGGAGAIVGNSGVLSAVRAGGVGVFPAIELTAVNGIGTVAAPVRILDGSDATGPEIYAKNTGTGDIAASFVTKDVVIAGDLLGLHNDNPNGIYLIQVEGSGNKLQLDIPFMPDGSPLMAGQTVLLGALQGDVVIGPSGSIATSGAGYTSLLGNNITSTGSITGLVNANALSGTITLSQAGGVTLGLLQAPGHVSVSSGGAIVDGNAGAFNIIAPSAGLFGAFGAGSLADPIETQTGILSGSATGTFGVVNNGDLAINGFTFSGTDAAIGTTGALSLMTPISATTGNLALLANNGMLIQQGITVGGDLLLNSGAGDLGIAGAEVSATNIALAGNNIFIGFNSSTAPTSVVASDLVTGVSAGNFNVLGGSTSGANALLEGQNVDLTVGTASGYLNVVSGSSGATAKISSVSPTTITVNFPNLSSGGYFVDGLEGAIGNGNTGFFAGGSPAVLDQNLIVTYGVAPPPPPPPPSPPPGGTQTGEETAGVDQVISQIIASANEQTDPTNETPGENTVAASTDPKGGEKDKKELPVCK